MPFDGASHGAVVTVRQAATVSFQEIGTPQPPATTRPSSSSNTSYCGKYSATGATYCFEIGS